jgi:hypothetical protein
VRKPPPSELQARARSATTAGPTPIAQGSTPPGPDRAKAAGPRTLRIGGRSYPVVLPSIRDPRLHLAPVIISIHLLGQVALAFRVSVVQILAAILACAVIEVAWTLHWTGALAGRRAPC